MARKTPKTLRTRFTHRPTSRELARLGNDLDSASRRAQRLAEKVAGIEATANGLAEHSCAATLLTHNHSLRYALERAAVQLDQWDNVEGGDGPELEHLRERAATLINILDRVVSALDFNARGSEPGHLPEPVVWPGR